MYVKRPLYIRIPSTAVTSHNSVTNKIKHNTGSNRIICTKLDHVIITAYTNFGVAISILNIISRNKIIRNVKGHNCVANLRKFIYKHIFAFFLTLIWYFIVSIPGLCHRLYLQYQSNLPYSATVQWNNLSYKIIAFKAIRKNTAE